MNPLTQFYRQPKVYISLPSSGIYYNQQSFYGDAINMPVYGMTGMDEILMQTPDALLTGDSTVKVIESCCPNVKSGWELVSIDVDVVLAAIRIATFGNSMDVKHVCPSCKTEHEYSVDVSEIIDHFKNFQFNNCCKIGPLTVKLQPLTYRQTTNFAVKNFELQQQLSQLTDSDDHKQMLTSIFNQLGNLQQSVFAESIESIDTGKEVVIDREHIKQWVENIDKSDLDALKAAVKTNRDAATPPKKAVQCDQCNNISQVTVELDQSSFFEKV